MRLALRASFIVAFVGCAASEAGSSSTGESGGADSGGSGGESAGTGAGSQGGAPNTGGGGPGGFGGAPDASSTGIGGTNPGFAVEAIALCDVIDDYRSSLGLESIPRSVALMTVAQAHVDDLNAHPETAMGNCNLHSWSDQGSWTACCYTPDHAEAECMWSKPGEITGGWGANQYAAFGYEIAASGVSSAEQSLSLWQTSMGHHDVIINAGPWEPKSPWPAMGCAIGGGTAVVWFGDATDPQSF